MVNHYLSPGEQTQFTERVHEHAEKAKNIVIDDSEIGKLPGIQIPKDCELSIRRTCKYISKLPFIAGYNPSPKTENERKANNQLKDSIFRQRDLDQILKDGIYPTCSDTGVLFRGLMATQGHPTAYVETFHEGYIINGKPFSTHAFGRVFFDGKSVIVNPEFKPIIFDSEVKIFPYIIFREGLDSWDIGIRGYEDIHRLRRENLIKLEKKRNHVIRCI
ncbi:hypothetical protein J4423_01325 [Candidatus Pacearchaeota archaeon]|nr:hypothetical protein [Candidatus Pacearchaeota archaeon]